MSQYMEVGFLWISVGAGLVAVGACAWVVTFRIYDMAMDRLRWKSRLRR